MISFAGTYQGWRLCSITIVALMAGMSVPMVVQAASPADDVAASAPPAPDYADSGNWVQVTALPPGASPATKAPKVDIFYLHPTTMRSNTLWNMDTADVESRRWTDESAIQRQASAFSGCCRIFAPRYRAATYEALRQGRMTEAFALAFSDVERAFDHYLTQENKGRPFILVGHSQGAAHVATLVEKRLDGTALGQQLVAAYIIGINLMEGEFGPRFKTIRPCRKPDDIHCILQWNAVMAGSDPAPMVSAYAKIFRDKYGDAPAGRAICINPVTFDVDKPAALSAESKGAVPGAPGAGAMKAIRPGAVAVQCEEGLAVSYIAPGLELSPLPGGSMHYHDIGLFWGDVRANAIVRSRAALGAALTMIKK